MKLSAEQQTVLKRMAQTPDEQRSADALDTKYSTMEALQRRGLVSKHFGKFEDWVSPRVSVGWKLTDAGKQSARE